MKDCFHWLIQIWKSQSEAMQSNSLGAGGGVSVQYRSEGSNCTATANMGDGVGGGSIISV